jgi:hypothetical protein
MIKPSQRKQVRQSMMLQAAHTGGLPVKPLDVWLQRLAHIAQMAVLALGIFGYFYTVLPVFQNQQLQEQAAKLELEKSAAQRQLDELVAQQKTVKAEISTLRESWLKERGRNAQLTNEAATARDDESIARKKSAEAETALANQLKLLDTARWELVIFDFSYSHMAGIINSASIDFNRDRKGEAGSFLLDEAASWPRPHVALLAALDDAANKRSGKDVIPNSYYVEIRRFIDSRQSQLQCTAPDLEAMRASFQLQLFVLESSIETETNASIGKLQKEYADKGQRVQITDEYRQSVRNGIRLGKVFTLERTFRGKMQTLRQECDDKAFRVIDEFRKTKGVNL